MGNFEATELNKGLSKDLRASKTPKGMLEFALNAVKDTKEGDLGSVHTEGGCEEQLKASYIIGGDTYMYVGAIMMTPNERILFLVSNTTEIIASFSKGVLTVLLTLTGAERFNISTEHPIQGVGHIRRGSEKVIYWNDTFNPDRVLNLSQLDAYRDNLGVFIPNLTLFNPLFDIPSIEMVSENDSGGNIALGSYRISLYYVDRLDNKTNVFYISNQIQVARGRVSYPDNQIQGGHNRASANNTLATYAYDPVNKSFTFRFTGLDIDYEKLVIVVTKYDDSNGAVSGTFIVDELTIAGSTTILWDFKGINASHTAVDYSTITASYARYESCQYMIHIQNRLIKANLTENVYDWAKVQRYVTENVQVKWIVKPYELDGGAYSHAKPRFDGMSLMRDEVASVGIELVMVDGTESPIIHVPGRPEIDNGNTYVVNGDTYTNLTGNGQGSRGTVTALQNWDRNPISIVAGTVGTNTTTPQPSVAHLNAIIGDTIERWKVWNTAIADTGGVIESDCVGSGVFGFHESNSTYPLVRDGGGDVIYPHTVGGGGAITMHKIRHHRVPNCELAPIGDWEQRQYGGNYGASLSNKFVYPLGVRLYNLVLPPEILPFVKGIKIYFGDRENNRTIREKGYSMSQYLERRIGEVYTDAYYLGRFPAFPASEGGAVHTRGIVTHDLPAEGLTYISHNLMTNKGQLNSEYAHQEAITEVRTTSHYDQIQDDIAVQYYRHSFYTTPYSFTTSGNPHHLNSPILDYAEAAFNTQQGVTFEGISNTIGNLGFQQANWILSLRDGLQAYPQTGSGPFGTNWSGRIWKIQAGDALSYSGSIVLKMLYTSLKDTRDVYKDLEGIQYVPSNDMVLSLGTSYDGLGNHCMIGNMYYFAGRTRYEFESLRHVEWMHLGLYNLFLESEDNIMMRGTGTTHEEQFYPQRFDLDYFLRTAWDAVNDRFHNEAFKLREFLTIYNPDYTIQKHPTPKQGLSNSISWDNDERGRFADRIIWSAKSNDEEVEDANLRFAALDYDDLSLDKGEIRMLSQKPNMLYAMTDYSIFGKPANAQGIVATDSTLFLKSSSFLDIPETELYDTGSGYGGCQSRFASVDTEFGTLYVNQVAGEVYLLNNKGVENLSARGLGRELRDRLPSKFLYTFREIVGRDYDFKDHTILETNGVGTRCYFDPIMKRAIVSKIDYEFMLPFEVWDGIVAQGTTKIWWNESTNQFMFNGSNITPKGDNVRFRKRNLTISYDFVENNWISYHSWIPKAGFNDTNNLYTMPVGQPKWFKHVEHNYLKYYDATRSPFIIEFVSPNFHRMQATQVNWMTESGQWNNTHHTYTAELDKTFDQAYVYNNTHTSGLMTLINLQNNPFGWTGLTSSQRAITRYNNVWRLNNIWDMRSAAYTTQPSVTEDWNNVTYKGFFTSGTNQGFIDKVPNASSYNMNKSRFTTPTIDNKEVYVRLIYNDQTTDNKLTVDLISLFNQQDLV